MRSGLNWLIMVVSGLVALSGMSAESVAAERFGDWEMICADAGDSAAKQESAETSPKNTQCRLQQAQAVNGGKDIVFLFNVALQGGRPVAIISTPLNVYLPFGLELSVDKGPVQRAVFETCNLTGCHAGFELKKAFADRLKGGKALRVGLQDTKSSKLSISVSLKGFGQGLSALSERRG